MLISRNNDKLQYSRTVKCEFKTDPNGRIRSLKCREGQIIITRLSGPEVVFFTARSICIARSLMSCGARPSVCYVGVFVSKRLNLPSNIFIAWWPHHSSFPAGDPTVKFRRDNPQQGRQIFIGREIAHCVQNTASIGVLTRAISFLFIILTLMIC